MTNIELPDFKNFKAKEKLARIKSLFAAMIQIVGKDRGILRPTYSMMVFSAIRISCFCLPTLLFMEGVFFWGILLLLLFFILSIYKPFFVVKRKALQSVLVSQVVTGQASDFAAAKKEYKQVSGRMFLVGLADYFVEKGTAGAGQKRGFLMRMLFSVLEEVWDALKNFMIPAVVIEKKSLKESVSDLKVLKSRLPETLVGVLAFDFVGSFLLGSLLPVFFILLLLGGLAGLGLPFIMDFLIVFPIGETAFSFALLPFLASFYLIFLVGSVFSVLAVSVKTAYFTIFYLIIQHPEKIDAALAPKIADFIAMKNSDES